jgi:hypothetical protein
LSLSIYATRLNEIEEKNTIEVVNGSMKGNVDSSHDACNQQQIYSFEEQKARPFQGSPIWKKSSENCSNTKENNPT